MDVCQLIQGTEQSNGWASASTLAPLTAPTCQGMPFICQGYFTCYLLRNTIMSIFSVQCSTVGQLGSMTRLCYVWARPDEGSGARSGRRHHHYHHLAPPPCTAARSQGHTLHANRNNSVTYGASTSRH